jgi:hypothetical protein
MNRRRFVRGALGAAVAASLPAEFAKAREAAMSASRSFEGYQERELPTLHEIRALSSHLYRLKSDVESMRLASRRPLGRNSLRIP